MSRPQGGRIQVPDDLREILLEFTISYLLEQPGDVINYAVEFFTRLQNNRTTTIVKGPTAGTPDESIISDEEEPPVARFNNRRKSVFAETYDPEEDDSDEGAPVVFPKSDAQRSRLAESVRGILLFRSLDAQQMQQVLDAMFEKRSEPGEYVIRQGDDGDNFYVIENGVFDVLVSGDDRVEKVVHTYEGSGSFGELALMYNMPRAASVRAQSPGALWAMDRHTFRRILLKSAFKKRKLYEELLDKVPMLKALQPYERANLADALLPRTLIDGELIIRQGDTADGMYFVEDGSISIRIARDDGNEHEVKLLGKGGYFGELALVTHKPRAASAYAAGPTRVAFLDVETFERLLGPCMEIMKRNIDDYEEQLVKLFGDKSNLTDVAQDTAYWDLKEKLSGVEGEHERLQRNMLDVQMQHEALSARYQDELRRRPETLHRVASSRRMCDVLEEYAGRVRGALRRAAADRAALARSYAAAATAVRAQHAAHARAALHATHALENAAHAVRAGKERAAEVAAGEAQARRDAAGSRDVAAAAAARADTLQARADELHAALHERERTIGELRREAELRAADGQRDERRRADLQRRAEADGAALAEASAALAAAEARADHATRQGADAVQNLEATRADLERQLASAASAADALRDDVRRSEREAAESAARADAARAEADAALAALNDERDARACDNAAAQEAGAAAERALAERAETVARLMRDVAAEAEARQRSDAATQRAQLTAQALQRDLQAKEEELAERVKIAQEMATEKERLQETLAGMQATVDNIQRELRRQLPAHAHAAAAAARATASRRETPEHDTDAVFRAPTPAPAPAPAPTADDLLYQFFSDSSIDGDSLDMRVVNARFEALSRGEELPPTSLQALKRRRQQPRPRSPPARQGSSAARADEAPISLSQVKTELVKRGRTFFRNKRPAPASASSSAAAANAKPRKFK